MNIDSINRWLSLAANFGVLIGIVFLAIEVRQNSDYMALQLEFGQPTQKIFDNNRDLQNSATAKIFAKAVENPKELTFEEGLVAASLVLNMLNEWEDRFLIDKAGLTGEIDWQEHISENIDWTLGSQFAIEIYRSNRMAFEHEFVDYVDGLLPQVPERGTYTWWTDLQSKFRN
ncbi:MAG TPA: hypothetical protein VK851_14780 [Anaerolineales bacterium]|nr:hypothetical protein [Anaerolineales bacterium]